MTDVALNKQNKGGIADLLWALAAKREIALAILLVIITGLVSLRNPSFLALDNIGDLFAKCAQTAVIACGVMLVIVTGEIDISVGSSMGLLTAILGTLIAATSAPIPGWGWPVWLGVMLTL